MIMTVFSEAQRRHRPAGYVVNGAWTASPETEARIDALMAGAALRASDIIAPPPIDEDALLVVHTAPYLTFLKSAWSRWQHLSPRGPSVLPNVHAIGRPNLPPVSYPKSLVGQAGFHLGDGSVPIEADTVEAALASAATAVHGARLIAGGADRVYALCRPPGHHAASDLAAGFCYLNNAALAAEHLARAGLRPAILDIDVHHGNGTQAIFYARDDILTVSIHAHPERFYPFFWGYPVETGEGAGQGFNLNLALARGIDDEAYLDALAAALARIRAFRPDVLVLAAGLDIAANDPLAGFAISEGGFARIGRAISGLALPVLIVQEGGYAVETLAANLAALLEGLGC